MPKTDLLEMTCSSNLANAGLKVTSPRLLVLREFHQGRCRHLTADEIYKSLHDNGDVLGLATVYRVLMQLSDSGILQKRNFDSGKSVFELTSVEHHDHLVCLRCGKITEFIDDEIEARQQEIALTNKFHMESHAMTIYGYCNTCKR